MSFLAAPNAEQYPVCSLMLLLCAVGAAEGADNALFPSVTYALQQTVDFKIAWFGDMSVVQLIIQAISGPFWASVSSRGLMDRRTILTIGTVLQGFATLVMWYPVGLCSTSQTMLVLAFLLRALNGFALASLRPMANSIVGDRFDDSSRGTFFGYIMSSLQFGVTITSAAATITSEAVPFSSYPTMYGWKISFITVGGLTMILGVFIFFALKAPPVTVDPNKKQSLGEELKTLGRLFKARSFVVLVFQGCFGLIPWRAFDFRTFFLEVSGLSKASAATVNVVGGFGATIGSAMGGSIGDAFNRCWPLHGRVLAAEVSVYGGIPIAFFSFMLLPGDLGADPFWYYFILTGSLGLVATWTPSACNNPVLCSLAKEEDRALILAWQTSLEGAVGAFGPKIFTVLLEGVFGFNEKCKDAEFREKNPDIDCDNTDAAGKALFFTSCVPWMVCGLMYSSLHYFYPRDLANMSRERGLSLTELTDDINPPP